MMRTPAGGFRHRLTLNLNAISAQARKIFENMWKPPVSRVE